MLTCKVWKKYKSSNSRTHNGIGYVKWVQEDTSLAWSLWHILLGIFCLFQEHSYLSVSKAINQTFCILSSLKPLKSPADAG